jgi:HEPN superfamily Swt1-like protein
MSSDKSRIYDQLKAFGMNNLALESALIKLEEQGIDIGHSRMIKKDGIVDPDLFEQDILGSAKRMADFYILYYCLENSIRRLIKDTLLEKYGNDWWNNKVPEGVRNEVTKRQDNERNSVMAVRAIDDYLSFTTLGELIPIIESNWLDFSDKLRSKKAVLQTLYQFNQTRNIIAHSCELPPHEIFRLKLLIKDWQQIQT